jgi:hypothetical protein
MNIVVTVVLVILAIVIAVKLLGVAIKLAGILVLVALAAGIYIYAQRRLKGPGGA